MDSLSRLPPCFPSAPPIHCCSASPRPRLLPCVSAPLCRRPLCCVRTCLGDGGSCCLFRPGRSCPWRRASFPRLFLSCGLWPLLFCSFPDDPIRGVFHLFSPDAPVRGAAAPAACSALDIRVMGVNASCPWMFQSGGRRLVLLGPPRTSLSGAFGLSGPAWARLLLADAPRPPPGPRLCASPLAPGASSWVWCLVPFAVLFLYPTPLTLRFVFLCPPQLPPAFSGGVLVLPALVGVCFPLPSFSAPPPLSFFFSSSCLFPFAPPSLYPAPVPPFFRPLPLTCFFFGFRRFLLWLVVLPGPVGWAALQGALWCASPFLWPLCPPAFLCPLRAWVAPSCWCVCLLPLFFLFRAPAVPSFCLSPACGVLGLGVACLLPCPCFFFDFLLRLVFALLLPSFSTPQPPPFFFPACLVWCLFPLGLLFLFPAAFPCLLFSLALPPPFFLFALVFCDSCFGWCLFRAAFLFRPPPPLFFFCLVPFAVLFLYPTPLTLRFVFLCPPQPPTLFWGGFGASCFGWCLFSVALLFRSLPPFLFFCLLVFVSIPPTFPLPRLRPPFFFRPLPLTCFFFGFRRFLLWLVFLSGRFPFLLPPPLIFRPFVCFLSPFLSSAPAPPALFFSPFSLVFFCVSCFGCCFFPFIFRLPLPLVSLRSGETATSHSSPAHPVWWVGLRNECYPNAAVSINWRASLVPAAAVIPAPRVNTNVAAVERLIVNPWACGCRASGRSAGAVPRPSGRVAAALDALLDSNPLQMVPVPALHGFGPLQQEASFSGGGSGHASDMGAGRLRPDFRAVHGCHCEQLSASKANVT